MNKSFGEGGRYHTDEGEPRGKRSRKMGEALFVPIDEVPDDALGPEDQAMINEQVDMELEEIGLTRDDVNIMEHNFYKNSGSRDESKDDIDSGEVENEDIEELDMAEIGGDKELEEVDDSISQGSILKTTKGLKSGELTRRQLRDYKHGRRVDGRYGSKRKVELAREGKMKKWKEKRSKEEIEANIRMFDDYEDLMGRLSERIRQGKIKSEEQANEEISRFDERFNDMSRRYIIDFKKDSSGKLVDLIFYLGRRGQEDKDFFREEFEQAA